MAMTTIKPTGVLTGLRYSSQSVAGPGMDFTVTPGSTNVPIIFEPTLALGGGGPVDVWMIATGASADWGGCEVWISADIDGKGHYGRIATIVAGGFQGVLTAPFPSGTDPDETNTLSVDLTESMSNLNGATRSDADNSLTLCYCDGEFISFSRSILTGPFKYSLSDYIRRGQYGTNITSHAAGTQFGRITPSTFRQTFPDNLIGSTIYIKLPAFNTLGLNREDLSTVAIYSYTLTGRGAGNSADSVAIGISAAGSSQGDATPLLAQQNYVSSVSAGQGVRIDVKLMVKGNHIYVMNETSTPLLCYPPSGASINSMSTNTAITIEGNSTILLLVKSPIALRTEP